MFVEVNTMNVMICHVIMVSAMSVTVMTQVRSKLNEIVSRHTLLGVQSWVRFCQQEFGEFPRPAWAVGSYSSGPPAGGKLPKFLSSKPCEWRAVPLCTTKTASPSEQYNFSGTRGLNCYRDYEIQLRFWDLRDMHEWRIIQLSDSAQWRVQRHRGWWPWSAFVHIPSDGAALV